MFQLLALNPPARAGRTRHRGGKRRAKKSRASVRKNSARKRAHRSVSVPKHRMPPRIKSGPNKGRFRKRRRNPTGHVFSGRSYRPRLRRRKGVRAWTRSAFRKGTRAFLNPAPKRRRRAAKSKMTGYGWAFGGTAVGHPVAKKRRRKARKALRRKKLKSTLRQALRLANPRRRRRRRSRARHHNPVRRRRRRSHARRHHNPRRRRRSHARRHHNPVRRILDSARSIGPSFRIPFVGWEIAPVEMAFDGVGIGAGAAASILIPQQVAQYAGKPWLNQGWYGVGLTALTSVALAGVGRYASPKLAKMLALGGAFATALRVAAQVIPSQTQQYVALPLAQAASSPMPMMAAPKASGSGMGAPGMLSADDIVAGEGGWSSRALGLRDWVGGGQGMRDWMDGSAPKINDGSSEVF